MSKNLRRIHIQSGASDRMGRPLDGVFEILLDEDEIVEQMERAYNNRSRQSKYGSAVVRYQPATKAEADFLVKGEAFGKKVPGGAA